MEIKINEKKYKVINDYGDTLGLLDLNQIVTDYYDNYDFLVGDWAYGKVRIKGFYNSDRKNKKIYNDIAGLDDYLKNNCAYGCKYFVLERIVEN